jgi:transposase
MPKHVPLSRARLALLEELIQSGMSASEISRVHSFSQNTVRKLRNRLEQEGLATELAQKHRLQRRIGELEQERDAILARQIMEKRVSDFFERALTSTPQVPEWTRTKRSQTKDRAIPVAFLSDLHLDEVIRPEQIEYVNDYNRKIAEKRLQNFFQNTLRLMRDHITGIDYEGIVVPFGGDFVSGDIHEELTETNEAPMIESILHWIGPLAAGVRMLAEDFKHVYIPCVVGNHGRRSRKPRAKNRAQDNFDWLLYHLVAREFQGDKRVKFDISNAPDITYSVYATLILLTHGDQFRGGSGIAGLLSPLMIGESRKRKRQSAVRRPFEFMQMGHWHQRSMFKSLIVNGSLKGYDEYAFTSNFDFEEPQQSGFLVQPGYGITIDAPIHVLDKGEKYSGNRKNTGRKPLEFADIFSFEKAS